MNKKIAKLRESQRIELENLKNEFREISKLADDAFRALPPNHSDADFYEKVMPLSNKARTLENRIDFLETELYEKKYANFHGYSDVDPYEVVEERTPNMYLIRPMNAVETEESKEKRIDSFNPGGFCGHYDNDVQDWVITSIPDAKVFVIRRHKDGNWYDAGGSRYFIHNHPVKFYDFNF